MVKHFIYVWCILLLGYIPAISQEFKYDPSLAEYKYKGYTLIFQDLSGKFDPALKRKFVETFYKVYPALVKDFNPKEKEKNISTITFVIDQSFTGLSYNSGTTIKFQPNWFNKNPEDIDVVTHQLMNILQGYNKYPAPTWLSLGISDYVRFKYGVNNKAAGWSLTPPYTFDSYINGYRTAARFLVWLEAKKKQGLVKYLYQYLQEKEYTQNIWEQATGKNISELWIDYMSDSSL
ncbi:MAG: basic secretory protein-like protein [Niabella sp.]